MIKKVFRIIVLMIVVCIIVILYADYAVKKEAKGVLYTNTTNIPHNKVGLLLCTSKYTKGRYINLYYKYRLEATIKLYKSGKINAILVSGTNDSKSYNEPKLFREDLIKAGIPGKDIYLDYAGFRTLDSVVRCKKVFGQNSVTIISQGFHNERAIYLAKHYGINAVGYNAKDVSRKRGLKTKVREKLARVKLLIDIAINKQPKFLGEKIEIE